jgi:hypothetical protein
MLFEQHSDARSLPLVVVKLSVISRGSRRMNVLVGGFLPTWSTKYTLQPARAQKYSLTAWGFSSRSCLLPWRERVLRPCQSL